MHIVSIVIVVDCDVVKQIGRYGKSPHSVPIVMVVGAVVVSSCLDCFAVHFFMFRDITPKNKMKREYLEN